MGDYTPRGGGISRKMRKSMNNQSLIGRFKEVLSWVSKRSGKHFAIWDEKGTTRSCSNPKCDFVSKDGIAPEIRSWQCPKCDEFHIRDENAAINGLYKMQKNKLFCSNHGDELKVHARCAWKWNGLGVQILNSGEHFKSFFKTACKNLNAETVISKSRPLSI